MATIRVQIKLDSNAARHLHTLQRNQKECYCKMVLKTIMIPRARSTWDYS